MIVGDEILGTDIALGKDAGVTPTGDLEAVSGLAKIKLAFMHRLITRPGAFVHLPGYGVGLGDFQNAPMTLGNKRQIASRIDEQFRLDPYIEKLLGVSIDAPDNDPSRMTIAIRAMIKGYGEQTLTFVPFGGSV